MSVIYQIYPRSFQDSDGDGIGDLRGIEARLDHIVDLGVDGIWLSPIFPSPLADFGYDVSDYKAIDPVFGDLDSFDALLAAVHERGLLLLLDLVPCHTSIEHPWFRNHPDWYIWAEGRDGGPPNNWISAFGGSAWSFAEEHGRWYLHSFYPEQPDLDWRNPEPVAAMQDVIRSWLERGADGYRIDAIDRLLKDPELRDDPPATEAYGLPLSAEEAALALSNSRNAPDTPAALAKIREAAGDALLVGEVYLPARGWEPYLSAFDAAFAFELLHSNWDAEALRHAISASLAPGDGRAAWVMSNHDFGRLASRFGRANERAALALLLTLPGITFIYQGDEIALGDGPGGERAYDRAGRDKHRHPMQWDASPGAGFTTGEPWLPPADAAERNVAAQRADPGSTLSFFKALMGLRRELAGVVELLEAQPDVLAFRRGAHTVAINTAADARPAPGAGRIALETEPGVLQNGQLAAHAAAITLD